MAGQEHHEGEDHPPSKKSFSKQLTEARQKTSTNFVKYDSTDEVVPQELLGSPTRASTRGSGSMIIPGGTTKTTEKGESNIFRRLAQSTSKILGRRDTDDNIAQERRTSRTSLVPVVPGTGATGGSQVRVASKKKKSTRSRIMSIGRLPFRRSRSRSTSNGTEENSRASIEARRAAARAAEDDRRPRDPYKALIPGLKNGSRANSFFLSAANQYIIDQLKQHDCKRVLDVGCGLGYFVKELKDQKFNAFGSDISPSLVREAQEIVDGPGRVFLSEHFDDPVFDKSFDAVLCSLSFHEMKEDVRADVWDRMVELTRNGGLIIVRDFMNPASTGCIGRIVGGLVAWEEESFSLVDPFHYKNFNAFLEKGGIEGFVFPRESGDVVRVTQEDFWQGNIRTIVCRNADFLND
mmetsp:Transcript_1212/g.1917  ORF Transcript_1212/g.1917 Transcript_1212/m.1917 type:complete len:407 (+) Transcript_1212:469-1689(+)|eukprot:CAMPEP_0184520324 /NCGR_PEP_ID=MMETSP0198_2-20121128/7103_1 /TAXON_ID=1112570 /ORGANISM="Thraustochytrium sp., Strain LLF1b" /LENGTH=406 /DNA_ID=CAMNT_0026910907 /DNA_START=390 /DNA_END=1610 /DNA_ORIENTATION=-